MQKNHLLFILLLLFSNLVFHGYSQTPGSPPISSSSGSVATLRAPSEYPVSWQRLLLQLSSTYFTVLKEGQVELDSSLLIASRSLGMSRLLVITEGFDDDDFLKKSNWVDKRDPGAAISLLQGLSGIQHLRLLVLIGAYYAFQPDGHHNYKDSVLYFLSKARDESKALRETKWGRQALCLLGKFFVEGNTYEQGATFFNQLTKECQAAGDLKNEARAWMYRGLYTNYSSGKTTKDRIFYLEKARSLYHLQKEPEGEINALTDIGYLWISNLQLKKGEAAFRQALDLEDSIGFPYTHYTTDNIAMATSFQGKFGEPLKYALQSVKTAEAVKDSIGWGSFYGRLGFLYSLPGVKNAESQQWLEKSLDRFAGGGDPSLYRTLANFVNLMTENGRSVEAFARVLRITKICPPTTSVDRLDYCLMLGDCYKGQKKYEQAENYYFQAFKLERETESMGGIHKQAYITSRIATLYFRMGKYDRAKEYFRRCLADPSHSTLSLSSIIGIQWKLAIIDSASGNYISAIRNFERYIFLLDSSFSIQRRRQVEELEIQYETERKENEIKIRDQHIQTLTQADLLRQASLKRADLIKNITIGGILLLLLTGGLLYRQYRQKQKINQVITQKNEVITRKNELLEHLIIEKDWLLKEVHHRVKNNLHTVICLLESQAVYLENDALKAIENSQHRIYAMSLIHQKLYQSEDIKMIDMANYLPEFIRYLRDSFGALPNIGFYLDIESLKLSVSQAVPLGLIVNEAVTNSIKYAFPDKRLGEISISLHRADHQIKLCISDNGIGIDPALKSTELNSLGLELIKGLSLDLKGEVSFHAEKGTRITVLFEADPLHESNNSVIYLEERRAIL